ncbi:nagb/rpia/CoA transferase-like protein [Suillus brevipes Sb2]|nr:nagb/rpia/CoA transferase-like protein [Suillus brevipes Sb2]
MARGDRSTPCGGEAAGSGPYELPIHNKSKVWKSVDEAVKNVKSGDVLLCGGVGLAGVPGYNKTPCFPPWSSARTLQSSREFPIMLAQAPDLISIGNLFNGKKIDKAVTSYPGGNKAFEALYLQGKVSLELCPQGTLVERFRAYAAAVEDGAIPTRYNEGGFANGANIPGIKTEPREFGGRKYAQQNVGAAMAKNAKFTIVEADDAAPVGSLSPNAIHILGIYVDRMYTTLAPSPSSSAEPCALTPEKEYAHIMRHRTAKRAAKELKDGYNVNLGIRTPALVPGYLEPGESVWLQSENGILGTGPYLNYCNSNSDLTPNLANQTSVLTNLSVLRLILHLISSAAVKCPRTSELACSITELLATIWIAISTSHSLEVRVPKVLCTVGTSALQM